MLACLHVPQWCSSISRWMASEGKRKLGCEALMLVPRFIKDPEIRSSGPFLPVFSIKQHRVILQPYLATLYNNAI